jgi:hypothetical protein
MAPRSNSSPVGRPPHRRVSRRSGSPPWPDPANSSSPGPVAEGRWVAVEMNADGSRPVVADLSAGAIAPGPRWAWIGQYSGAGIRVIAGALLILLAVRRHDRRERAGRPRPSGRGCPPRSRQLCCGDSAGLAIGLVFAVVRWRGAASSPTDASRASTGGLSAVVWRPAVPDPGRPHPICRAAARA